MTAAFCRCAKKGAIGLAIATVIASVADSARAHVVMGRPTLSQLTHDSDLVVRARIVDPATEITLEKPSTREVVVVAEVLETLKGSHPKGRIRFIQHGHGSLDYVKGEEVAIFVKRIERSRELSASAVANRIRWVSEQEAGSKFALDTHVRADFTAAVRSYAGLAALQPESRAQAMHRITLKLLASPHRMLSSSALRDLVVAGDRSLLSANDLPALQRVFSSPDTPVGIRIGLLVELERRGFVDGPPLWVMLLRTTHGEDRLAVVRASAAHPSVPLTKELVALLESKDTQLVAAAAVALGSPGHDTAVPPLAKLLQSDAARVRMAAIRSLGRVATPRARQALADAAEAHPDATTRRRAEAEVRVLDQRRATVTGAPDRATAPRN
jgi:hypothetical protein